MRGRKKWRPVCAGSQEREEEKWQRRVGEIGSPGVHWKWVDPIKIGRRKI